MSIESGPQVENFAPLPSVEVVSNSIERKLVGILMAGGLLMSACTGSESNETGTPPGGIIETGTTSSVDVIACSLGSTMEGCYEYTEMFDFYREAVNLVDPYLQDQFEPDLVSPEYAYIKSGDSISRACMPDSKEPAPLGSDAYLYCPVTQEIVIGQDQLWSFYTEQGDAAPVVGLAHEVGHHIQNASGNHVNFGVYRADTIRSENQADCIAGAWFNYVDLQGYVELDDIDDIEGLISVIASSEADVYRDHGTVQERTESFIYGYDNGIQGCNQYFTDYPIIGG